ncbi:MAG: histidine kinase dimerization/phospho-acceptor domain-containing protein [Planctomycetota bacterium]
MIVGERQLQEGFAQFVAVARELESGYRDLKARFDAIDLELQHSNAALRAALDEREAIFAAMPLGLVSVRGGEVAVQNREGERLCALARAHGVDLPAHGAGEIAVGDGLVRVRRVDLPDGELVLLEDRSRVQELEREVSRLDRLAGLSELALGIAHEIKNPLNGVVGFAALLERAQEPGAARRYAGKIVEGVRQVDDIVKSLLGFARPDRKQMRRLAVVDLVAAAAAAVGLPAARVVVTGEGSALADADALARVLGNLLRNAVEAAADVAVTVHVERRGSWLEIVVADDGPGVSAALGARALEPMVSTKATGTGLGLALSSRVLAFLGGRLELLNAGEPGARFRILLPLTAGPAAAEVAEVTA